MSINQHQYNQLTEMGISLWQRRSIDDSAGDKKSSEAATIKYDEIDLEALSKEQLFTDILLCSGLSLGEVIHQGEHLNLGLFNWFFVSDKNDISWTEQQLFTPSLSQISTSPILKKQLWQLLSSKTQ